MECKQRHWFLRRWFAIALTSFYPTSSILISSACVWAGQVVPASASGIARFISGIPSVSQASPSPTLPSPTPSPGPVRPTPRPPVRPIPSPAPLPQASPRPIPTPTPAPVQPSGPTPPLSPPQSSPSLPSSPAASPSPAPVPAPPARRPSVAPPQPAPSPPPASRTRPAAPPLTSDFDRYLLGPGDSLFVNVLRFPDLSIQGTLDLEGNLLIPLVGALRLQGLTLAQASRRIETELNRFVVNPQVDLILVAQRPVRVTVLGNVVRPGLYGLESPLLATALTRAGGTTQRADLRAIQIRRTLPGGAVAERVINLYAPLERGVAIPNIRLADGDTVIVPALTSGAIATYNPDIVARSTLAQPQITIRVLNYAGVRRGTAPGRQGISRIVLPNGSDFVDALTVISPNPDTADLRDIALIRFDPSLGRAVSEEYNGRRALRGDLSQNPTLQHNDVIVIGRNFISRVTYLLNTITQPFRDVLGFTLFFDALIDSADNVFRPSGDD